jgi:hypothetical protein
MKKTEHTVYAMLSVHCRAHNSPVTDPALTQRIHTTGLHKFWEPRRRCD